MEKWTRERIIEAAIRAAAACDQPLSVPVFCRRSGAKRYHIYRLFPNGWTEVRELAGIPRNRKDNVPITDEQLLQKFHRVVCEIRAIPTWSRFEALAHVCWQTAHKRFGGRRGTLQRYREWLEKNHPESPFMQLLFSKAKGSTETAARLPKAFCGAPRWTKRAGVVFGAPIHFRGLRHAPTNEHGVVYLFGMVSSELGLIVEAIQAAYSDCEAKRCIDPRQNRWQAVRIEFEFYSSHFREHGHDPAGCDVIVCWEHDWPECPLEVIELRSVIARLKD